MRGYVGIAVLGLVGALAFGTLSALQCWLGFGPPSDAPNAHYAWAIAFGVASVACIVVPIARITLQVRARRNPAAVPLPDDRTR